MVNIDSIYKNLGNKITKIRGKKGLTQEEVALEAGLNRAFIGYIERAERRPTVKTIAKIAKALDVKIWELFKF